MYQDYLGKIDPPLLQKLKNKLIGNEKDRFKLIPPKSDRLKKLKELHNHYIAQVDKSNLTYKQSRQIRRLRELS